jgi:choline/glycine/proline betaine transport protein
VFLRRGGQSYDIYGYDSTQIIDDILNQFEKYLHFLHVSPGVLPWNMEEHDEMLQGEGESSQE